MGGVQIREKHFSQRENVDPVDCSIRRGGIVAHSLSADSGTRTSTRAFPAASSRPVSAGVSRPAAISSTCTLSAQPLPCRTRAHEAKKKGTPATLKHRVRLNYSA